MRRSAKLQRLKNAYKKVRAGLPLFGENVSPEEPNDVFRAHESIYGFFANWASGQEVLDIGCGSGYGANMLANAGARYVEAIDIHQGNITYARKHYRHAALRFEVADAETLRTPSRRFDLIVSSNVFEHLHRVEHALDQVCVALREQGTFLLAVPPIMDDAGLRDNQRNPYHHSNLYVHEWRHHLATRFDRVKLFAHLPPPGSAPDFGDPFPSRLLSASFRFEQRTPEVFPGPDVLTAIFACTYPIQQRARKNHAAMDDKTGGDLPARDESARTM